MFFLNEAGFRHNYDSVAQLFTMIIVFIFVLVLTYFSSKLIAKIQKQQMMNSNIRIVETMKVMNNKYLMIIESAGKFFLVSVCKDSISLIGELDKDEIKQPLGSNKNLLNSDGGIDSISSDNNSSDNTSSNTTGNSGEDFKKIFNSIKELGKAGKREDDDKKDKGV